MGGGKGRRDSGLTGSVPPPTQRRWGRGEGRLLVALDGPVQRRSRCIMSDQTADRKQCGGRSTLWIVLQCVTWRHLPRTGPWCTEAGGSEWSHDQ
jgi:hypothetical protein